MVIKEKSPETKETENKLKKNGFSGRFLNVSAKRLQQVKNGERKQAALILNAKNAKAVEEVAKSMGLHTYSSKYWSPKYKMYFRKIVISKTPIKESKRLIPKKHKIRDRFELRELVISQILPYDIKESNFWKELNGVGKRLFILFIRSKSLDGNSYSAQGIKRRVENYLRTHPSTELIEEFKQNYEKALKARDAFLNEINLKKELGEEYDDFKEGLLYVFFSLGLSPEKARTIAKEFKERIKSKRRILLYLLRSKDINCRMCVAKDVSDNAIKEIFYTAILGEVLFGVDAEFTLSIGLAETNFRDAFKRHGGGVMQITTQSSTYILNNNYWKEQVNKVSRTPIKYNITSMHLIHTNRFANIMEGIKTIMLKMAERGKTNLNRYGRIIAKYYNGNPETWDSYGKRVFSTYSKLKKLV